MATRNMRHGEELSSYIFVHLASWYASTFKVHTHSSLSFRAPYPDVINSGDASVDMTSDF